MFNWFQKEKSQSKEDEIIRKTRELLYNFTFQQEKVASNLSSLLALIYPNADNEELSNMKNAFINKMNKGFHE